MEVNNSMDFLDFDVSELYNNNESEEDDSVFADDYCDEEDEYCNDDDNDDSNFDEDLYDAIQEKIDKSSFLDEHPNIEEDSLHDFLYWFAEGNDGFLENDEQLQSTMLQYLDFEKEKTTEAFYNAYIESDDLDEGEESEESFYVHRWTQIIPEFGDLMLTRKQLYEYSANPDIQKFCDDFPILYLKHECKQEDLDRFKDFVSGVNAGDSNSSHSAESSKSTEDSFTVDTKSILGMIPDAKSLSLAKSTIAILDFIQEKMPVRCAQGYLSLELPNDLLKEVSEIVKDELKEHSFVLVSNRVIAIKGNSKKSFNSEQEIMDLWSDDGADYWMAAEAAKTVIIPNLLRQEVCKVLEAINGIKVSDSQVTIKKIKTQTCVYNILFEELKSKNFKLVENDAEKYVISWR